MKRIKLSLKETPKFCFGLPMPKIIGWIALACGVGSFYFSGVIFVPLGVAFSLSALFLREFMLGIFGLILCFIGLLTSIDLLFLIGKTILLFFMGWDEYFDFIKKPVIIPGVDT